MKLRLEKITDGEEEVLIRYHQMNATVQAISDLLSQGHDRLAVSDEEGKRYLDVEAILYFESIDGKSFAYTQDAVYQVNQTLRDLVYAYGKKGFFRSAKAMVINIYRIVSFKSQAFGRLQATLDNGEEVLISRKYAATLRQILEEGAGNED